MKIDVLISANIICIIYQFVETIVILFLYKLDNDLKYKKENA
jgi:hypothetical protein